ncbi:MAG: hypothetical protein ACFFBL_00015 [Promethearchaeota archaeon]
MKKNVESHIPEILDALGSPEDMKSITLKLVKIADQYDVLTSNNMLGEAAAIVYIAGIMTNHPVTLTVIAEKAGISPATVRKYKTHLARGLKTKEEWPSPPLKGK